MKITEQRTATSVTVDLRNLDTAFQDQKIKALLAAGYRIATVITATDEGHPIAILIFEPQERPVFALKNDKWGCLDCFCSVSVFFRFVLCRFVSFRFVSFRCYCRFVSFRFGSAPSAWPWLTISRAIGDHQVI